MADQLSSDLASLKIDRDAQRPRASPLRWVAILAALFAAGGVAYFIVMPAISSRLFKTEIEVTEISLVSPAQASVELTSTGYVVPQTVSQVAAKVAGRVSSVSIKQGQQVAAGDVLLELDVVDQKAAIAAARARALAARAQVETARAQVAEARELAERAQQLAQRGVGAKATADDAAARVRSLQAAVKASEASARAAQAEVESLEVTLDHYTVRAPIAGTILSKPPEIGEIVGPTFGGVASQLGGIELADFSTLAIETDVPEGRLHLVSMNGPCEISLDAFPGQRYRGKVLEITPRVNRAKATVTVKVSFVDPAAGVLPDMAARVSFLTAELDANAVKEPPKLVLPKSALAQRSGASVVFVLEGELVRMVPVTLGEPFGDGYELTRGPTAGTRVVRNPSPELTDGQKVKEREDG